MKYFGIIGAFALSGIICLPIHAARLTFYDGTILDGKIKSVTQDKIILEYDFGDVERLRKHVVSISNLLPAEEAILKTAPQAGSVSLGGEENGEQSLAQEMDSSQTAYQSLVLLKEKLEAKHARDKNSLLQEFTEERMFLEDNLETLATRYNDLQLEHEALKESFQGSESRLTALQSENGALSESILKLKNEVSSIHEIRLQSEVAAAEKIQTAIARNKEIFEQEKGSLISSYENQLNEKDGEQREANLKVLEVAKTNSDLTARLAEEEQKNEKAALALTSLEAEFANYKEEMQSRLDNFHSQHEESKGTLEQMLTSSADSLGQIKNENQMLKQENEFLKDEIRVREESIEKLEGQVASLLSESEKHREDALKALQQMREMTASKQKDQEVLLQSIVDSVLAESEHTDLQGLAKEARNALVQAKEAARAEADDGRSSLFQLFQKDISRLNASLQKKTDEMNKLNESNLGLKTELQRREMELSRHDKIGDQVQMEMDLLRKENESVRKEMQEAIKVLRDEAKSNLQNEKENLRAEYESKMKNLEQQIKDQPEVPKATEPVAPVAPIPTTVPKAVQPEERVVIPTETIIPALETEEASMPSASDKTVQLPVGVISQVEKDFNRIYIDTQETVAEGDEVFMGSDQGEASFKIVKVYQALNGAIAEITDPAKMAQVQLKKQVYVKG